jgi:cell division protein ZapE
MSQSFSDQYAARVASGEIEIDPAQRAVATMLARLEARLAEHRLARKSSSLGWLFGRAERQGGPLKGLYLFGDVGRGKTMLMDLFFASSPVVRKRRLHFHEFMIDVHERINLYRHRIRQGEIADTDPVRLAADAIAEESWLICFDEFHVTDIADAMVLGRLFARLFERDAVVVATSNVAPDALYQDGLNRALFLPFVALLQERVEVVRLDARTDFRLEKLAGLPVWHWPADAAAQASLDGAWRRLTGGHPATEQMLTVKGHALRVPQTAMGVARFSFHDLCERPFAAADYLKVAHEFHTVLIDRIPMMGFDDRNAAKRFIILIDTLYDHAVKLIASAAAPPDRIYQASDGFEAQEFRRTSSRIVEMGSQSYLALAHGPRAAGPDATQGIVET